MVRPIAYVTLALLWTACSVPGSGRTSAPVRAKTLSAREQPLAPRAIVATPPPPARIDPPRPPDPGGDAIWRAGHYQFRAGNYLWVPGAWVVPPRTNVIWVPGFYKPTPDGGIYINGHWRKS